MVSALLQDMEVYEFTALCPGGAALGDGGAAVVWDGVTNVSNVFCSVVAVVPALKRDESVYLFTALCPSDAVVDDGGGIVECDCVTES